MIYLLYVVHVVVCIFLILVVLLQQGKGADLSVFGGGGSMAAFGARSATTLLHRLTVGSFVAFILTTLGIAILQGKQYRSSVMAGAPTTQTAPAPSPTEAPAGLPATSPAAPTAPVAPAAPDSSKPAN